MFISFVRIDKFDVNSFEESSSNGYILEVDLECLDELLNYHNYYPLAPQNLKISSGMLSKYCSDIAKKYGIKVSAFNKLVPNSGKKK